MTQKQFILSLQGVNKTFDGFKAINDLNFYMDEGELRVIIGPNGAGKSTMLDIITGRTRADKGTVEFGNDTDLTRLNEYQINRLGIGRKFQTPSVYVDHTVFENIWLSLEGSRSVWSTLFSRITPAQRERIDEVLTTVGLADKAQTKAGALSHGQKQWLEIGMLLAQNPKLLLVDEPAAGMTDEETIKTGQLLISLAGKHSVIVIEHDMVFVRQIARKVTVLHQGHILCEGTVDEVQADERVIEVYRGKKESGVAMLAISKVHVSYEGSRILRDVSLTVALGEVVCLMGRNGVGKTTTLKAITGLVKLDAGSVKLDNHELTGTRPDARARHGLGYVPQGRDIFPNLTVWENLRVGAVAQGRKLNGDVDRVFHLFPVLKDMTQRKGGVLSGGQQQQLAIGRALLTNPKVLLLDEPTEGIQPNIINQIGETIKRLRTHGLGEDESKRVEEIGHAIKQLHKEGQIGILLVEQYLDFCIDVGDRFYIMDRGSIVAQGSIPELSDELVKQHLTV